LTTLSDLNSAIASFLFDRTELTPQFSTFIAILEGELNQILRVNDQLKTTTLTLDANGEATLPDDFLSFRSAVSQTNPVIRLDHIVPGTLDALYPAVSGYPQVFSIVGNTLRVRPINSADVKLTYYATLPALTEGNPTNWLLTKAYNVYLYGALKHAADFENETERKAIFENNYIKAVGQLIDNDKNAKYGARTVSRIAGPTP
jgi:hypothetical protein